MGYPMFIQYLSLYCRTPWSLFLRIPLPLWAVPHAHPLCGSLPARAGASPALPPVSGRERDIYYSLVQVTVPSAPTGQISTWKHRFLVESTYAAGRRDVYEVNWWLWLLERGKPRLGGLSVADTEDRWTQLQTDSHRWAVETLKPSVEGCKVTWHWRKQGV